MASTKIEFSNQSGELLSGVLEAPEAQPIAWALFAHCFTCSKKSLASSRISRLLAARGIGVLRFDFTGLGESDGDFSQTGISTNVEDLRSAIAWMQQTNRPVELMVGHSLGGAATVLAAADLPEIKAVVTLGAPSDAAHVIAQFKRYVPEIEARGEAEVDLGGRPFVLRNSLLKDLQNTSVSAAAARLKRPLMVLHAPTDEVVSIDNATELFVSAKHPKSFVSLDDANHLLTRPEDAEFVADVIFGWAQRYLSLPASKPVPKQTHKVIVRETGRAGPYQNEVFIDGVRYLADEPLSFGGAGTGPDPYAWVTAGLGACTAVTLRMYANRKSWPVTRVTVSVDHERRHAEDCLDCGPKDQIDVFKRDILIEGALTGEQYERMMEIANRCPVHRTLEAVAVIETRNATLSA